MEPKFVGRVQEIELLNRLWGSPEKAQFLVLYGRRRVGKTRLLSHWIKTTFHNTLLWVADQDSKDAHLRQFSQILYGFSRPGSEIPSDFTYATWEQALAEAATLARTERLGLFIDEFTYLLESDPSVAGKFQKMWDRSLENANIFLCLSGSHLGMMQRGILAYQAPLYGRTTAKLHLQPLSFGYTQEYFPHYSAVDRVAIYAIFGGVPQYWGLINANRSVTQNVKDLLLSPGNPMDGEARLLLHDFLSEIHNYVSILRAIAHRRNTPKEISSFTGISNVHLSSYLSNLSETGYVARFEPVMKRQPTRSGRYHLVDPYLRFYFRFLASRKTQLAMGEIDQAYAEIKRHMIDFIGTHTWEELCREWVLRAANRDELPVYPDQVGSDWGSNHQVDVVGVNFMRGQLVLGECKWTTSQEDEASLRELVEKKAKFIIPGERNWQVYFLGFSRNGWTDNARRYADEINHRPPKGDNWRGLGMRLIDLAELDGALAIWAAQLEAPQAKIEY